MAVAVGYFTATLAADPQAVCTALEAEATIGSAVALGTVGEAVGVIVDGEVLAAPARVVFKVTTDDPGVVADLTNAATAVGGLEVASGYPAPA